MGSLKELADKVSLKALMGTGAPFQADKWCPNSRVYYNKEVQALIVSYKNYDRLIKIKSTTLIIELFK